MVTTTNTLRQSVAAAIEANDKRDFVKRVSLFGSYLHGTQTENSDIDLLIEFKHMVGLMTLAGFQLNLEAQLGKKVDLVEKGSLSKYIRTSVLSEAKVVYER